MAVTGQRGRWRACALAGIVTIASVALGLWVVPGTGAVTTWGNCATATGGYNPVLKDYTINQGVGSYPTLTRGKTTLIRLFLTEPSCATAGQEQITGATLTLTNGLTSKTYTTPTPALCTPTPSSGSCATGSGYPNLDTYTASTNDGLGNPVFRINTADIAGPLDTGSFKFTMTAKVFYQYVSPVTGTVTAGPATGVSYSSKAGSSTAITATVAPAANHLHLLIVPMGDPSQCVSYPTNCAHYPAEAQTQVQNGLQTLARMLPVPDTVGAMGSGAGIQYAMAPSMLDLKSLGDMVYDSTGTAGKGNLFCGNGLNMSDPSKPSDINRQLAAAREAYNATNAVAVDRVVGVVWSAISVGGATACNDGLASGYQAWIRVFPDMPSFPSMSGSILAQEVSHTWGDVQPYLDKNSPATPNPEYDGGAHSKNVNADGTSPGRGYNVTLAKWLATPMSGMKYSANSNAYLPGSTLSNSWHNNSTVFEDNDYRYAQCQLTPSVSDPLCAVVTKTGAVGTFAAGPSFVVTGTSDGTAAGTSVHSYFTNPTAQNTPETVKFFLVQRKGTAFLRKDAMYAEQHKTDHTTSTSTSSAWSIDSAIPADPNATEFEVWFGDPGTPAACTAPGCLYTRSSGGTVQIDTSSSTPVATSLQDFTKGNNADERVPAVSPDGSLIAWSAGGNVTVQRRNAPTNLPSGSSGSFTGSDPAWSHDGSKLYYVESGDVKVRTVTVPGGTAAPSFSAPTTIYDHTIQTSLLDPSASHPTISPDGTAMAVAIQKDIWYIDLTVAGTSNPIVCELGAILAAPCHPLDTNGNDAAPAWGPTGLVAYQRGADIWTLDPAAVATNFNRASGISGASAPAWGGDQLFAVQNVGATGGDLTAFSYTGNVFTLEGKVTTGGVDAAPSLSDDGTVVAWDRNTKSSYGHDVYDGSLEQRSLTFTASGTNAAQFEADVVLTCGSGSSTENLPVRGHLMPTSVSNGVATFNYTYTPVNECAGGIVQAWVTDGFTKTPLKQIGTVGGSQTPVGAIYGPSAAGDPITQYEPVVVAGTGYAPSGAVTVQWYLTGPAGSGYSNTLVGTGQNFVLQPPSGGWVPGTYTLTELVTDSRGNTFTATRTFTIVADQNRDGVPPVSCISDTGPGAGSGDADHDAIANSDDPDPCTSAANVTTSFNPQTYYVPSTGNVVTVYITPKGQSLRLLDPNSVVMSQVGPWKTSFKAVALSIDSKGVLTAQFDRQAIASFLTANGLVTSSYVPMVVTGSAATFSIYAVDTSYPIVTPS